MFIFVNCAYPRLEAHIDLGARVALPNIISDLCENHVAQNSSVAGVGGSCLRAAFAKRQEFQEESESLATIFIE